MRPGPVREGEKMNRFAVIVLAIGAGWVVVALALCAWVVPSDPSGYYLVNHGRAEHHATRLAAVGDLVLVGVLLAGAAAVVLARLRRSPTGAVLGAAPLLLLAGLLPLTVTLMSRYPGQAWLSWLVLAAVAVGVLAPLGPLAHRLLRAQRSR
jgi:hypothetical protein